LTARVGGSKGLKVFLVAGVLRIAQVTGQLPVLVELVGSIPAQCRDFVAAAAVEALQHGLAVVARPAGDEGIAVKICRLGIGQVRHRGRTIPQTPVADFELESLIGCVELGVIQIKLAMQILVRLELQNAHQTVAFIVLGTGRNLHPHRHERAAAIGGLG